MIKIKDITEQLGRSLDIMCDICPFANEGSATMIQVRRWNKSKANLVETVQRSIEGLQFETARVNYDAGLDRSMTLQARKDEYTLP